MSLRYEASAVAARELGVIVQPLGVSEPDDFIEAFDTMDRDAWPTRPIRAIVAFSAGGIVDVVS